MQPQVRYHQPGEIVGELGPLFLRVIDGVETTDASVDRLGALLDAMVARWPVVGVVAVVEHGTPQPGPDIRRRVDQAMARHGDRLVVGYAFAGLGFWHVEAQEFGAERAAALGAPVFVERDVEALAAKLAYELVGLDPAVVVGAVAWLRAQLSRPTRR